MAEELTAAEQAAIPLISRAGLNLLRMHSLLVVAEQDIGSVQSAYQRLVTNAEHVAYQLSDLARAHARYRLAQEAHELSDDWAHGPTGSMLVLPHDWRLELAAVEGSIQATLLHWATTIAVALGEDSAAALTALAKIEATVGQS